MMVALIVLVAYWALFAAYPLRGEDFQWMQVGLGPEWHRLSGFGRRRDANSTSVPPFTW